MSLLSKNWDMFHFSRQPPRQRFGCRLIRLAAPLVGNYTLDAVKRITNDNDTFNPGDINHSIASLCSNKACGIDVLFAEHLLHASPEIHVLLSICLNAFIVHGFLPNSSDYQSLYRLVYLYSERGN